MFGASRLTTLTPISFTPVVYTFTTAGLGNVVAPAGATKVTVEAIGPGGNGFGQASAAVRASGAGGCYAGTFNLSITNGQTIYYRVGTGTFQSWVNIQSNSGTGITTSIGCFADIGSSASSSTAGTSGNGSIGTTIFKGGNGAIGTVSGGGGAGPGGVGSAASAGGAGGTGNFGTGTGPGNGGLYTAPGNSAGGGGASVSVSGNNPAGAAGAVRITFS